MTAKRGGFPLGAKALIGILPMQRL